MVRAWASGSDNFLHSSGLGLTINVIELGSLSLTLPPLLPPSLTTLMKHNCIFWVWRCWKELFAEKKNNTKKQCQQLKAYNICNHGVYFIFLHSSGLGLTINVVELGSLSHPPLYYLPVLQP